MRVSPSKLNSLFLAIALVMVLATLSRANSNTDSVAFQGRLTDASDNAVADGPKDLTLSLWTDSIGGTMVFSEIRTVTTSKGLYSTCLGCGSSAFEDAMQIGDLWLQTQLAGQPPMAPRTRIRNVPRAMVASGVYGEATSGSAKARGIITTKPNLTGPSTKSLMDVDSDGDGHPEYAVTDSVTAGSASRRIWGDADEDGDPDGEIAQSMTPTTSSVAIKWKGTGADANRGATVSAGTNVDSASVVTWTDDDGDGIPDASISQTSTGSGAQMTMKFGDNLGPSRISTNLSIEKQKPSASWGSRCDVDEDGAPESSYDQYCSPDSIVAVTTVGHGGGGSGGQAGYNMRTRINDLETRLRNIGLLARTSSSQSATDTGALTLASVDLGNNGTPDVEASVSATTTRSELKGHFQTGDVPTQSQFSTVLDAVGSHTTWSNGDGGPTNIGASVEATVPRVILKQYFQKGDTPTQGQFSNLLDATIARTELKGYFETGDVPTQDQFSTQLDGDGTRSDWSAIAGGVTTSVSIVASEGADPITHSSGAKLTAGGVWTNASDENLKENFRPVDGGTLLNKIDELPIQQWNYKSESDDVTHIGPTAQDFKSVFGVGESDKTISTIDPSGIALAGIKELHKENNELKAQNAELKKQLDDLKKKVEQLLLKK